MSLRQSKAGRKGVASVGDQEVSGESGEMWTAS